jgi:hypothetical protein
MDYIRVRLVQGSRFKVQGSRFKVQGLRFKVNRATNSRIELNFFGENIIRAFVAKD